jgi:predicted  nucleic acid-binding Zn-ribbon protein
MSWKCKNCGRISDERPDKCPSCGNSNFRKVWKRARGRPKKRDGQDKLIEVLKLLPLDGSKIQAKELKERAHDQGISPNTLFDYLKILENNFQVKKDVDESAYPPKVYYRKLTEEEFFGRRNAFLEDEKTLKREWSNFDKVGLPKGRVFKKALLAPWLLELTRILTKIGSKAREIKDVNKRKEFIDITTRIHLLPKLLEFSSVMYFEPKDWESGLDFIAEFMVDITSNLEVKKKSRGG